MTHGFKNGRLIAEQGTIERVGVGEFLKFDDGTDNFQTFSSNGSPEGVIPADKGSIAHDITNGSIYKKTTDTVNTGWIELSGAGGVAGSGITFLASATASASSSVDFTSFIDSTYDYYLFTWIDVLAASGAYLEMRTSTDGGSTFDSGAGDYSYQLTPGTSDTAASAIRLTSLLTVGAANQTSGSVYLINPSGTAWTNIQGASNNNGASAITGLSVYGGRESAGDVDAVQFLMSTGNITSGTFKLYGFITPS